MIAFMEHLVDSQRAMERAKKLGRPGGLFAWYAEHREVYADLDLPRGENIGYFSGLVATVPRLGDALARDWQELSLQKILVIA
jgi:hypothetical protein